MTADRTGKSPGAYAQREAVLADERGAPVLKESATVRMALVYPHTYEVGMASTGFQTVYLWMNRHPEIRCERVFMPMHAGTEPVLSLESGLPLVRFDIIGVSLSFEPDIPAWIRLLHSSGLPVLARNRGEKDPLVLAGGVALGLNPAPVLPFVDAMLAGEGETVLPDLADQLVGWKSARESRKDGLHRLAGIPGFFVPGISVTTERRITRDLDAFPVFTPIVTPRSHFSDMFVLEVSRGCRGSCFFCASRSVSSPYRVRSEKVLWDTLIRENPGAGRVGLEGSGISDYPHLEALGSRMADAGYQINFSSLRADRITQGLVDLVDAGGTRSFTVAPESGTECLRRHIGKAMDDETILEAMKLLARSSLNTVKMYFLIGLPGERDEDILAIPDLIRRCRDVLQQAKPKKQLRVSINAFIPKPFTLYQWAPMASAAELNGKRTVITKPLSREKGIVLVSRNSRDEVFQAMLALGDDSMGLAVMDHVLGKGSWKQILKRRGIDAHSLLHAPRNRDMPRPWEIIVPAGPGYDVWERYKATRLKK